MASVVDKRGLNLGDSIAVYSADQASWLTGAGYAISEEVIEMYGMVRAIAIRISSVTANPTVVVTLTDANGNEIYNSGSIADGTDYHYTPTEFLPTAEAFPVGGDITVGITPSADAGGTGQELTVDVDIYLE